MENEELIPIQRFCVSHHVEISFIDSLQEYGLVQLTTVEQQVYVSESQLDDLERFARLHYDLEINLEGIEAIHHLLARLKDIQVQKQQLENRLRLYEEQQSFES